MNRDDLLSLERTDLAEATLPNGKTQKVRSLSVEDIARVSKMMSTGVPPIAAWIIIAACDDDGNRLFNESDAGAVAKMPVRYAKPISEAAITHNGLDAGELKDATDEPTTPTKKKPKVIDTRTLDGDEPALDTAGKNG